MSTSNLKIIPLAKLKANQSNPRIISESKLKKLVNSLLVFPNMMELRPITLDDENVVLGGNMRQTALGRISQMTWEELKSHLESLPEYDEMPEQVKERTLKFWERFLNKPQVPVQYAHDLTESEKQQFIIKDNVSFGDWDYDELENWDNVKLEDWGVDTLLPDFGTAEKTGSNNNLPPELDGVDLMPEGLEKLQGDDKTAMQRIILCYKEDEVEAVAKLLGLTIEDLQKKVVYRLDELGV
jgi:hypothetical protein